MSKKAPDAFRTISEAADALGLQPHVLRHWEDTFGAIRPMRRAGGRRYYRTEDLALINGVRVLLHEEGLTTKGVQKVFADKGAAHVAQIGADALSCTVSALTTGASGHPAVAAQPDSRRAALEAIEARLIGLQQQVRTLRASLLDATGG